MGFEKVIRGEKLPDFKLVAVQYGILLMIDVYKRQALA